MVIPGCKIWSGWRSPLTRDACNINPSWILKSISKILSFLWSDNLQKSSLMPFEMFEKNDPLIKVFKSILSERGAEFIFWNLWKCIKNYYLVLFTSGSKLILRTYHVLKVSLKDSPGSKFIKPHNLLLINDHDQNWTGISKYKMVLFYRIQ